MATTPKLLFVYPNKDDRNWFSKFQEFADALDLSLYSRAEDLNVILSGGGEFTWNGAILTWDGQINLFSPVVGYNWYIPAGSLEVADGRIAYVVLPRAPSDNTEISLIVGDNLSSVNTNLGLLVLQNKDGILYFRNGRNMGIGDVFNLFEQSTAGVEIDLDSVALTGTPTAPTATQGTNSTQIATTAFVNAEIAADAQPLDADLTAIAALSTTGLVERTGAGTAAIRSIGVGAGTSVPTTADGDARWQTLDSDLTAVAGLSTTGLIERTGAGTAATRAIGVSSSTDILDRASGDGRYTTGSVADPQLLVPPYFRLQDNSSNTGSSYGNNTSYTIYIGRAPKSYTSFVIRLNVTTGISGTTWAELAIGKSTAPAPATAKNITIVGYTDVSSIINTTGAKSITISVSGGQSIDTGDHLWLTFAKSSTGTPGFRSNAVADLDDFGLILNAGNVRPSTIQGTPTSFAAGVTIVPIQFLAYPS